MVWGAWSFQKLPIDAYPDLSPPHVEIITQWPGHAPRKSSGWSPSPSKSR
jgi:Cu/Ag efflux pump CusA